MHAASAVKVEGPTPERVRQAGADFDISHAIRSVEVVKNEQRQTEQIRTPRARVSEDPFTRMACRGQLDSEDEDMNRWLGEAGKRYRRLHESAGRSGIASQDLTRGFTTKSQLASLLDDTVCSWSEWNRAHLAMPRAMRQAVDQIILQGVKPEDIHLPIESYADPKRRTAVAMTLLRLALHDLAKHFAEEDARESVAA